MSHTGKPTHASARKSLTRRRFMAGAGAAAVSFTVIKPQLVRGSSANSKINLGLIGCGGRGTWIAKLFREHGGYNVIAAADYFQDRADNLGNELDVPQGNRFTGLKGYLKLLDKVDAVAIESPPYFHPEQAAAAVEAGKHTYVAKPIAVDVPGGISIRDYSSATITNCTFSGNSAGQWGGGIYIGDSSATITNCIMWENVASSGAEIYGGATVSYSDIQDGWPGTGNINSDPLFVTGPQGDYYLSQIAAGQGSNSPCVDAGSDTSVNLGLDVFTTRTDKFWDEGIVDMGFHYSANIADLDDSGNVDWVDFAILASQWQQIPSEPSADIAPEGGDGIVNYKDLGLLVDNWLWN